MIQRQRLQSALTGMEVFNLHLINKRFCSLPRAEVENLRSMRPSTFNEMEQSGFVILFCYIFAKISSLIECLSKTFLNFAAETVATDRSET